MEKNNLQFSIEHPSPTTVHNSPRLAVYVIFLEKKIVDITITWSNRGGKSNEGKAKRQRGKWLHNEKKNREDIAATCGPGLTAKAGGHGVGLIPPVGRRSLVIIQIFVTNHRLEIIVEIIVDIMMKITIL